jgi:(1->4)-alpha-D-glucan 1-alpha-D-glucosylmutase
MSVLEALALAYGIGTSYHDIFGTEHRVPDASLRALLGAMSVDASDDESAHASLQQADASRWRARLPALVVLPRAARPWTLRVHLPSRVDTTQMSLRFTLEDGSAALVPTSANAVDQRDIDAQTWSAVDLAFDAELPLGYHGFELLSGDAVVAASRCAVTPPSSYRPAALRNGGRTYGLAVQLYGLASPRNWGIGDFSGLGDVVERAGALGAGIVGVNPLHALFPHNPLHVSPYSPSSRLFANTLYLDVEVIDDFHDCPDARALVESDTFQARLAAMREAELVDYAGVARAKHEVLTLLHARFQARPDEDPQVIAFARYRREQGEGLERHALFEALQEHFHRRDGAWGWPAWPSAFRDPHSAEVQRFARAHAGRVDYYAYLQWQADVQRAGVADRARDANLCAGVYTDLAVSIDAGGAERWVHQDLYADGASVGAPPDAFNREGQDWGLPPMMPGRLREAGYAPFIATLRANMRHAGALRVDHVMGLMRLFWIPRGGRPAQGAYVAYPFDELIALLALESVRNRCLVIGEDLGTVPDEVRRVLAAYDVLSYRVLMFERDSEGRFKPPSRYPEAALATASTHDLPTLAGWWSGEDIETRARLGIIDGEARHREHWQRGEDRARLVQALRDEGALPGDWYDDASERPVMTPGLAVAIMDFLASSPSVLCIAQLEDALLVRPQANLPGTVDEHPNWRRKLPATIEATFSGAHVVALLDRLRERRPSR